MKRAVVVFTALLLFASLVSAQEAQLEPTQNPDAIFRLFNTRNIYTLLKLDTRDGRIWQVQWGGQRSPIHRAAESGLIGCWREGGAVYSVSNDECLRIHFARPRHGRRLACSVGKAIGSLRIADQGAE